MHFRGSYAKWALLSAAAAEGNSERVRTLLAQGASVDLPFEWTDCSTSTLTLVAANMLHGERLPKDAF